MFKTRRVVVGCQEGCSVFFALARRGGGGATRASYVDDGPARRRGGCEAARVYCRLRGGGGAGSVECPARRGGGASSSGSRAHYVDGPRAGRAAVAGAVAARRRSLKYPLSVV